MNAGQVVNISSCKNAGKVCIKGKSINIADFKKLISELFSGKKEKSGAKSKEDLLSNLISQLSAVNFTENGVNSSEIKTLDADNISSLISGLNLDELKMLLSKVQLKSDNISKPDGNEISSSFNIPEIPDKTVTVKELKTKLMEIITKEENSNTQNSETDKLEDYGDFKKSVLLNRKNELNSPKEKQLIIQNKIPEKVSDKTDSPADLKEKNKETEIIDTKDKPDNIFSSLINKIEVKNTSLGGDTELPVISKENLNEDIIKAISFMKDNDVKNLTVKVIPKELGEITIELAYSGDKISAKLTSSTNSTFQLLDQNAAALNSELSKNGVNIQNVSVNLYSGNFSDSEGNQGQEYKRREGRKRVQEIEQDETIDNFENLNIFA